MNKTYPTDQSDSQWSTILGILNDNRKRMHLSLCYNTQYIFLWNIYLVGKGISIVACKISDTEIDGIDIPEISRILCFSISVQRF